MTEPLCDEEDAEQFCESNLAEALRVQADNLDALQCLANLRMLRKRDAEAKRLMKQVVDKTLQICTKEKQDQSIGNIMAEAKSNPSTQADAQEVPSISFRMQTCRFLTELQLFKKSVKILETITAENDEVIESWYLLAFALVKLKKY